ncbi:MAG: amino acid adenylation domain-containing protein [Cyanomargarita calcarea GSE-NOS-MK-12-04C]|uniref:Amino acid adenylation domain-containing protein n=1 Tax=Cyanomargarita calcarea GSE-NOS-MK-12-04C TaxID=2839659 RepID=A0A951QL30_9CYAN|nr:amino acid adenylation domain-containing protein [Cyanomargarita calcarea GSE-NOS-MK-12-04C]
MSETRLHHNLWQYTGEKYQPHSDFWKSQIVQIEAPFVLEGISQSSLDRGEKQIVKFDFNETVTEIVDTIAKKDDLGTYVIVVSGIAYLLSRYTGQSVVQVDSPLFKANLLSEAIVEQVPLVVEINEQNSLKNFIGEFSQIVTNSYNYQNFPYQELIANGRVKSNVIAWLPKIHDFCSHLNSDDLAIEIHTDAAISLVLHYNTKRFDNFFVRGFAEHLQNLFLAYAHRDTRLVDVEILSSDEKKKLMIDWAVAENTDEAPQTIDRVFEIQVSQTPLQVAIQTPNNSLTYRDLDQQANQLASYLRTQYNIQPNDLIGVMLERSERLIIGLLAILKAGGAYIPIDLETPSTRLEFILRDAPVKVLLMEIDLLPHLQNVLDIPMFAMDVQLAQLDCAKYSCSSSQPSDLAYVLYTSGSTGTPKGVMVEHQSFVNMAKAQINAFGIQATDRVLQFANASFDASLSEIFMALFCGATLVLIDKATIKDQKQFLAYLEEQKVTVATFPPAYLRALEQPDFKHLRVMITAGEAPQTEDACYYAQKLKYFNAYGLTETAVCATYSQVDGYVTVMGKPIPNTAVYLLDSLLRPVPIGVVGEICVAGKGLARGYLHNPNLTASKFVENPFVPGEKLYRTGDFGKRLATGELVFVGRLDHQVKVRGYRIELGEIEAALHRHPEVKQAVALAKIGNDGNKEIVAYIVAETELDSSQVRTTLSEILPEYMLPAVFVLVEELPLTANGKIDRRLLATLDTFNKKLEKSFDPPRTPTEEVLAAIWAEVFGLEQVGIYDNFFEIGGHSLLATQVISRIRQAFSIELPQHSLFETPTIAELSEVIEATHQTGLRQQTLLFQSVNRNGSIPLSFAQQRLWFLNQLEGDSATYNISTVVRLTGILHVAALEQAVAEIVSRHETLRTTFLMSDGSLVQAIAPSFDVEIQRINLQLLPIESQSDEVQRLAVEDAQQPFDLVNGPLVRITLLILGKEEHSLLVAMHHIVSDGWSIGIFIQELSALYQAFSTGRPSPLPKLSIQYADFALWQREWLSGEVLETQLNYWKKQLDNLSVLELPTDQLRPAVQTFRGAKQSLQLPHILTSELKILSRQEAVTLFMTLVAAFKIMLHCYTSQDDIIVGTDVANRNRVETEGIIGFFVNQLVLRTNLSGNPSFQELLRLVRDVALNAYAHQDLPFNKLVTALNPERNLNRTPLFQTKFVLQNAPMPPLELTGLTLSVLEVDNRTAKFDLLLTMWDTEQGLAGNLEYSTDLFNTSSIVSILENFELILHTVVTQPNIRLNALAEVLREANKQKELAKYKELQEVRSQKFKNIKPHIFKGAK